MKKLAAILCFSLALSSTASASGIFDLFSKGDDVPDGVVSGAVSTLENAASVEGTLSGSINVTVDDDTGTQVNGAASLESAYSLVKDESFHIKGDVTISAEEDSTTGLSFELYAQDEGSSTKLYSSQDGGITWDVSESELGVSDISDAVLNIMKGVFSEDATKVTTDESGAYRLERLIPGITFQRFLETEDIDLGMDDLSKTEFQASMDVAKNHGVSSSSNSGIDSGETGGIGSSGSEEESTSTVDESLCPSTLSLSLSGTEDMDVSEGVRIDSIQLQISFDGYNTIDQIPMPEIQEAASENTAE